MTTDDPILARIEPIMRLLVAEIVGTSDAGEQFAATCAVIAGLLAGQSDETVNVVFGAVREYRAERRERT